VRERALRPQGKKAGLELFAFANYFAS
jgi:hypothetical protein